MTRAQKEALRPHRAQLSAAFAKASLNAANPGEGRTWFVPFLAMVLKVYEKLASEFVDGRSLRRALAKDPRLAFFKLLKPSGRDPKTRSRWAGALLRAHQSNISAQEFATWLKKGGGVAGRAAELAKANRARKSPANDGNTPIKILTPQPSRSPEADNISSKATGTANEHR